MSLWQCIQCALNALNLLVCVFFSLCLWWPCFWQTAVGVMHSSLEIHLLLITDKKSPEHPERMQRYRAAAELFEKKVSPNREEEEPWEKKIGGQWFRPWMGWASSAVLCIRGAMAKWDEKTISWIIKWRSWICSSFVSFASMWEKYPLYSAPPLSRWDSVYLLASGPVLFPCPGRWWTAAALQPSSGHIPLVWEVILYIQPERCQGALYKWPDSN